MQHPHPSTLQRFLRLLRRVRWARVIALGALLASLALAQALRTAGARHEALQLGLLDLTCEVRGLERELKHERWELALLNRRAKDTSTLAARVGELEFKLARRSAQLEGVLSGILHEEPFPGWNQTEREFLTREKATLSRGSPLRRSSSRQE